MKIYLLLTCAFAGIYSLNANAIESNKQLQAVKKVFEKSFERMDANSDGKISKEEYLAYKFEEFRDNMIGANSFDDDVRTDANIIIEANANISEGVSEIEKKIEEKNKEQTPQKVEDVITTEDTDESVNPLEAYSNTLKEMAEYKLDDELSNNTEDGAPDGIKEFMLSTQDVMPEELSSLSEEKEKQKEALISLDKNVDLLEDSLLADDNIENNPQIEDLLSGKDITINDEDENTSVDEIGVVVETIRSSLPKKIDEITTWTDVKYNNKLISYVYKADIDKTIYTDEEFLSLQMSIKNQACEQSRMQLCQKVKPIFIDKGINLQIQYIDNKDQEITYCEFNQETCN